MKSFKFLFPLAFMAFVVSSCQKDETTTTIVDFEDVTLTSGISASTSFTSGNCKFSGNPVEFWNGGVLCSSKNDTVTTGYLNQFSTIAGSGVPSIKMIPDDMEIVYVQTHRKDGPFGASGVGEMPLTAPHAAIINGIYNACGARIRHLPARPEKVLEAMPK